MTYRAAVITASNRSAAGLRPDTSGPILVAGLRDLGIEVSDPLVVPDGEPVGEALRDAVASGVDLILTTGGTGLSPTDRTPEMTRLVIDREVPGLADAIRDHGTKHGIATAVLSRGIAGLAGPTVQLLSLDMVLWNTAQIVTCNDMSGVGVPTQHGAAGRALNNHDDPDIVCWRWG